MEAGEPAAKHVDTEPSTFARGYSRHRILYFLFEIWVFTQECTVYFKEIRAGESSPHARFAARVIA